MLALPVTSAFPVLHGGRAGADRRPDDRDCLPDDQSVGCLVDESARLLDVAVGVIHLDQHVIVADREMEQRALRRRAPVPIGRHVDGAHTVESGAAAGGGDAGTAAGAAHPAPPCPAAGYPATWAAAARIASIVAWGWEIIERCEPGASLTFAPARSAIERCRPAGITLSSVPMTTQLGRAFQAAPTDGAVLAPSVIGRCSATISRRSRSGRSWATTRARSPA